METRNADGKKTVLIVDDEDDIRFVLRTALERNGFRAAEAVDGQEALDNTKILHPDAIILDIMLPKVDGITVHHKLKEDPDTASIPIVIITGRGQMREFLEAKKDMPVLAYLEKPFPVSILIQKLKEVFM